MAALSFDAGGHHVSLRRRPFNHCVCRSPPPRGGRRHHRPPPPRLPTATATAAATAAAATITRHSPRYRHTAASAAVTAPADLTAMLEHAEFVKGRKLVNEGKYDDAIDVFIKLLETTIEQTGDDNVSRRRWRNLGGAGLAWAGLACTEDTFHSPIAITTAAATPTIR